MNTRRRFSVLMTFISLLMCAAIVEAQVSNTCPALVNQAMSQVGTLCANLSRNNACYGNNNIVANFRDPAPPADVFDVPGDIVGIADLHSIEAAPVDPVAGTWGIGMIRIQANLPNTLPGQSVLMVTTGGQQVENGVPAEDELVLPDTGVTVITNTGANTDLRPTYPANTDVEPSASIPGGTSLLADAITPDGQWVRVVFQDQPGWIARTALPQDADLSGLTQVGPDDFTHMQSFYIMAQVGQLECAEAPAVVVVQGPRDTPIDLQIHDVKIRIESTILLRSAPDGQRLELVTLYGLATINPDSRNAILVPPGFVTSIAFAPAFVSLGTEGDADEKAVTGRWSTPRILTPDEFAALGFLNGLPANLLNYPLVLPRIVRASGVGGPIPRLEFSDEHALEAVQRACDNGQISSDVCDFLLE